MCLLPSNTYTKQILTVSVSFSKTAVVLVIHFVDELIIIQDCDVHTRTVMLKWTSVKVNNQKIDFWVFFLFSSKPELTKLDMAGQMGL